MSGKGISTYEKVETQNNRKSKPGNELKIPIVLKVFVFIFNTLKMMTFS